MPLPPSTIFPRLADLDLDFAESFPPDPIEEFKSNSSLEVTLVPVADLDTDLPIELVVKIFSRDVVILSIESINS